MSDPKALLNRGLVILTREVGKLERLSEENELLNTTQREDLCAYMSLLRMLIGKDLGAEDNSAELSDEELKNRLKQYG